MSLKVPADAGAFFYYYSLSSNSATWRSLMAGRGSSLPSVMNHNFSRIPSPLMQRSVFNRTHTHKTTFDAGYLVPILVDEVLPGDTMSLNANMFARLATMVFPVMDNLFLDSFWFFVPNRLIWNNWEKFQGAQDNPDDPIDFEVPVMLNGNDPPIAPTFSSGSLGDYFGLPVGIAIPIPDAPMSLPFRAYNLIFNEWFRDQNVQDSQIVDLDDGPDNIGDYGLRRRGKRHDYFTSCLPFPQKGDAVSIPLGTFAPVVGTGNTLGLRNGAVNLGLASQNGTNTVQWATTMFNVPIGTPGSTSNTATGSTAVGVTTDPLTSGLRADLTNATAATINQLREAFAIQHILEADARGGTRYVEHLRAHWGVISPDFRLQRPEYLGGSSQRIDVRGVAQTSASVAGSPQANLSSYAQVGDRSGFFKSFTEHGLIIGLVNVRADLTYQEGMRRLWSRRTRFDFYNPELAHLGEQAVLQKEIWASNDTVNMNTVFGYQERWAEYRYFPSLITGLFRSAAAGSLDRWHLSQVLLSEPSFSANFIEDDPPIDRVIAVPTEPHMLFDSFIEIRHTRPMPVYSRPGLQRL